MRRRVAAKFEAFVMAAAINDHDRLQSRSLSFGLDTVVGPVYL
jgi:hypothetical protein